MLPCVAVCCSVLQCVAACCSESYHTHEGMSDVAHLSCCSVLQCVAVCCSVLQCVLQCVAVCCSEALVMLYHLLHVINESRQMYEGMSCVVVIWSMLQYDAVC